MTRKEINISPIHFKRLVKEFGFSRQTIYNALKYTTNSELAQRIRTRAKSMLIEESDKVSIVVNRDV